MGYGTFYNTTFSYKPNLYSSNYDFNFWSTIISAASGNPKDCVSNLEVSASSIADAVLKCREIYEDFIQYKVLSDELFDAGVEKPEEKRYENVQCYINDLNKDDVEFELDQTTDILSMLWQEIIAVCSMPPVEQKNEDGDIISWPDWIVNYVRNHADSIRSYSRDVVQYKQCIQALKDNPEIVKSC